jgi:hypothetical protein
MEIIVYDRFSKRRHKGSHKNYLKVFAPDLRAFHDMIVERMREVESEALHFRESDDNKRFNAAY